jgi:hypothetical protein
MFSAAHQQRTTIWLAIVSYGLLASGLPLPVGFPAPRGDAVTDARLAAKDRSRPFPCMDKPCGCATAEQCFANCCCHTRTERLAWAKAHRVEPALLAALECRVAADTAPAKPAGGCCAAPAARKPACCDGRRGSPSPDLADKPDVCTDYQSLAAEPAAPTGDDSEPATPPSSPNDRPGAPSRVQTVSLQTVSLQTVSLQAMLACGGILTQWLAVGGSLPPPRVTCSVAAVPLGMAVLFDATASGVRSAPDAPPPRA